MVLVVHNCENCRFPTGSSGRNSWTRVAKQEIIPNRDTSSGSRGNKALNRYIFIVCYLKFVERKYLQAALCFIANGASKVVRKLHRNASDPVVRLHSFHQRQQNKSQLILGEMHQIWWAAVWNRPWSKSYSHHPQRIWRRKGVRTIGPTKLDAARGTDEGGCFSSIASTFLFTRPGSIRICSVRHHQGFKERWTISTSKKFRRLPMSDTATSLKTGCMKLSVSSEEDHMVKELHSKSKLPYDKPRNLTIFYLPNRCPCPNHFRIPLHINITTYVTNSCRWDIN